MKEIKTVYVGGMNNAAHFMFVSNMADAAKVLQQHVKDYKIDIQAQLDKETGLLVNFIQDLEGKFAEQVKTLSLGAFVEKLKAADEDVRALTGQRTDERSAKTAGALKAARAASDEAYKMLVLHVNAHALLEGEGLTSRSSTTPIPKSTTSARKSSAAERAKQKPTPQNKREFVVAQCATYRVCCSPQTRPQI